MTRQQLRVELQWFCGCGSPEEAAGALLKILQAVEASWCWPRLAEMIPDEGARYLVLYMLDDKGYTEHGTAIRGGWLTERGRKLLAALVVEKADEFDSLWPDDPCCIHGYEDGEGCPECGAP